MEIDLNVDALISSLITSDQTANVPGRVIGKSRRLTSDLLEYSNIQDIPGHLVTVDIEKAFNSVAHTFLCSVLQKFGFGKSFIRWVSIILNGQESCVMSDGHSTGYFFVVWNAPRRSNLFIFVMEILFIQILRSNENIHGLKFFGYEFKLSAFADDVSYFLKDIDSVKELLKLLEQSSQIIYGKSETCGIGSKKGVFGAFSQFRIVNLINDFVKILGCHYSYNSQLANDRNFYDTMKSTSSVLNLWQMGNLSLLGRVQILKTIGFSKILYLASMANVPPRTVEVLSSIQNKFIGKARHQKLDIRY